MSKASLKTPNEIKIMKEGGAKLASIRTQLIKKIAPGVSAMEIDELAEKLIKDSGGSPSFKMVPGYYWSTCVNVNDGVVHGIPKKETIFKNGDIVSVDVGLFYKGFHTDTSVTVQLGKDKEVKKFIDVGKLALTRAIEQMTIGNTIFDISSTMQAVITDAGYEPIRALTGHGVGKSLHEDPFVPCFVGKTTRNLEAKIEEGLVLAIEVMYAAGSHELVTEDDGWTISTRDGKISALFEETVAATVDGPVVLTA